MSLLTKSQIIKHIDNMGLITVQGSTDKVFKDQIGPCGYDCMLGNTFKLFKPCYGKVLDPNLPIDLDLLETVTVENEFIIQPNQFVLAETIERFNIPKYLSGLCITRSSFARCGIYVNTTILQPGWEGILTLEIYNSGSVPVRLECYRPFCHITFNTLSVTSEENLESYSGKFQHQTGTTTHDGEN